jgi:hypothetical protein
VKPLGAAWTANQDPDVLFGLRTDLPVPGDYDGDGKIDPAVFRRRPGNGTMLLKLAGVALTGSVVAGDSACKQLRHQPCCDSGRGPVAASGSVFVRGFLHETPPTASLGVAGARIDVFGGPLSGQVFATDDLGRFRFSVVPNVDFDLRFTKAGYTETRFHVIGLTVDAAPDVTIDPEPGQVVETVSGHDVCTEHPLGPDGFRSRLVGTFPAHHDGYVDFGLAIGPWVMPFSIGVQVNVFRFNSDGSVAAKTFRGPVIGGHLYGLEVAGELEQCQQDYFITYTHPR